MKIQILSTVGKKASIRIALKCFEIRVGVDPVSKIYGEPDMIFAFPLTRVSKKLALCYKEAIAVTEEGSGRLLNYIQYTLTRNALALKILDRLLFFTFSPTKVQLPDKCIGADICFAPRNLYSSVFKQYRELEIKHFMLVYGRGKALIKDPSVIIPKARFIYEFDKDGSLKRVKLRKEVNV